MNTARHSEMSVTDPFQKVTDLSVAHFFDCDHTFSSPRHDSCRPSPMLSQTNQGKRRAAQKHGHFNTETRTNAV
jgi:hypothetical protein